MAPDRDAGETELDDPFDGFELGEAAENVRRNIAYMRKFHEWRLEDLSQVLGRAGMPMSVNTLSKIERGTRSVSVTELEALIRVLGVFGGFESMTSPEPMGSIKTLYDAAAGMARHRDAFEQLLSGFTDVIATGEWTFEDVMHVLALTGGDFNYMQRAIETWERMKVDHPHLFKDRPPRREEDR